MFQQDLSITNLDLKGIVTRYVDYIEIVQGDGDVPQPKMLFKRYMNKEVMLMENAGQCAYSGTREVTETVFESTNTINDSGLLRHLGHVNEESAQSNVSNFTIFASTSDNWFPF